MDNLENTKKSCCTWKIGLRIFGMVIIGFTFAILIAFLFAYIFMILWNWLMPEIFNLKIINYWQAFGLIIMSKLVFGTFGCPNQKGEKKNKFHDKIHKFIGISENEQNNNDTKDKHLNKYKNFWKKKGQDCCSEYLDNIDSESDKKTDN